MLNAPLAVVEPVPGALVYFGDSLTDPGNLYAITEGVVDEAIRSNSGGPDGEASDGPTHATYASGVLGVENTYNYAIAGAEAVGVQTLGELLDSSPGLIVPPDDPQLDYDINLGAQIDRYLADFAAQDLSNMTAVLFIGGNDYLGLTGTTGTTVKEFLANAYSTQVLSIAATFDAATELLAGGVDAVTIYSLLEPNFYPTNTGSDVQRALAEVVFESHNAALAAGVAEMQTAGLDVRLLDLAPMTDALIDDPSSFGFISPVNLTLSTGDPGLLAQYDPDQVMFWDDIHVSTATHGVFGAFTAYALEAGPIALTATDDAYIAQGGVDLVFAYGGADRVSADSGADSVFGGSGADVIAGGGDDDQLSGGADSDRVYGGAGRDVIAGDAGDDFSLGNSGADVLLDGLGSDTVLGGLGDDVFIFVESSLIGGTEPAQDIFSGRFGSDTLYLVVSAETAAVAGTQNTAETLAMLNIVAPWVEQVVIVEGRAGLDVFQSEDWYASADLWGLV